MKGPKRVSLHVIYVAVLDIRRYLTYRSILSIERLMIRLFLGILLAYHRLCVSWYVKLTIVWEKREVEAQRDRDIPVAITER